MRAASLIPALALVVSAYASPVLAKGEMKAEYQRTRQRTPALATAVPNSWKQVRSQTAQRVGRVAGNVVNATALTGKTGKRAALTVGFASAIIALGAADLSYVANNSAILEKGMEHAGNLADAIVETGKTLASVGPQVGAVAGIAAGSLVAAPAVKYMGKGVVRVWMKGGPAVDMGIGAFHAALSLAATQDPTHAMAVGFGAQSVSFMGRMLTPGASKLGPALPQ